MPRKYSRRYTDYRRAKRKLYARAPTYTRRVSYRRAVAPYYVNRRRYNKYYSRIAGSGAVMNAARAAAQAATSLSPCVKLWVALMCNPWYGPIEACNPFTPPIMSERFRVWARWTMDMTRYSTDANVGYTVIVYLTNPTNNQALIKESKVGTKRQRRFNNGTSEGYSNNLLVRYGDYHCECELLRHWRWQL